MVFHYDLTLLKKGISYRDYLKELEVQVSNTSAEESERKLLPYTLKNLEIMKQLEQEAVISEALIEAIEKSPRTEWLVITEGWCGDAAFIVPIFAAIERSLPKKVNLKLYFRDQNPELMDAHLNNGGRSIPKLIILDEDLNFIDSWGPRPEKFQKEIHLWRERGMELKELIPKVREWYQEDDTTAIQEELIKLFSRIKAEY